MSRPYISWWSYQTSNIVVVLMTIDHTTTYSHNTVCPYKTIIINDLKMKAVNAILWWCKHENMLDVRPFHAQRMQTNFMHIIIIKNTCFSSLSLDSWSRLILAVESTNIEDGSSTDKIRVLTTVPYCWCAALLGKFISDFFLWHKDQTFIHLNV